MDNSTFQRAFLHPRYWLLWLGLGVWWLLAQLPYGVQMWLGKYLGVLMYAIGGRRKHIATVNLALCFPDLDDEAREQLLRENFHSYGRAFFEIGIAWWWPRSRFDKICRVEGLEILQELEGQGALLTAIHFTTLEIGAAAISNAMSIDGMHRPHKNALYDYIQGYGRRRRGADTTTYPRKDVRGMLKALKSGRVIWYAPDQDYGIKQGIFAPFMGVMAATITATARFASAGNARIIPLTQQRLPDNQGYLVKVHPPLEGFPVGDDYQDAVIVNQLVERMIREQPASYMWVHRRFKNRPPGESSVYK